MTVETTHNLAGMCAIVTGSGGVIGRAIAVELARAGARVACVSIDADPVARTVRDIEDAGGVALAVAADVTDREQVDQAVQQAIARFGNVDILINNAGVFRAIGGLWQVDPDLWWSDVTTNLLGSFLCCRAVLPHMIGRNQGIIINMAGGGYDGPNAGGTGYASSKAALMRMTDTLACELSDQYRIQVYGFWPGFVRSGMTELLSHDAQGLRWLPHVQKGLEAGEDHPAADVGRAIVKLIGISVPDLSGRIFAYDDDFAEIARRASEIKHDDLYQLRLRLS
jgi:NAD(P)-dependent dehydrogenase (short-subunit alcohol dehydrogenase family)